MPAARLNQIEPFHVMRLLAEAKAMEAQGHDVIHLEVGEPDFATPPAIVKAGMAALAHGHTRYTAAAGLPQLREAIAGFYAERFGVHIDPRRIFITPGASGALQLVLSLLVDHGDEVLLTDPGYPCNRHLVTLLGGAAVNVPVGAQQRFQLTPADIAAHATPRSVAALVASPSNPTGTVLEPAEIAALDQACRTRGMALIVDEIYQGLVYERPHETALAVAPDAFVINSFSKFFQMTGWRLGWLVAPEWAIADLDKLAQNLFLAAPTPAQHAALAAFTPETLNLLEERRQTLDERRRLLCKETTDRGLTLPVEPQGAFYLWLDCSRYTDDTQNLAEELLQSHKLALTPGSDFGENHGFIRIAYTQPTNRLIEASERLSQYLYKKQTIG
ncbi:pyridoxal phosphate-dependent aminotransferase [Chitinibacteraceae bacterium HSL-7]